MLLDKTPYRILVVEDNSGDFALVEDYLFEQIVAPLIFRANNFKEAAKKVQVEKNYFDIILLDLTLPDKSGKELIDDFLKITDDCPVIVLTGYTDVDFSVQSISLGVADYLLKEDLNGISLYKSIIYCLERRKITIEIKESEKRYSDLFHLSPQPMWVYDNESLFFLDVNKAAISHYGYSEDEFLKITLKDIRSKEGIVELEKALLTIRKETDKTFRGIFKHLKKNGETISVDVQTNHIQYKNRRAQISIITDITERTLYIKTIETQNEKLKHIAWAQSHLVRAPLARILGLADLLQSHTEENVEEQKEILKFLVVSANELDSMIKEISDKIYVSKTNI